MMKPLRFPRELRPRQLPLTFIFLTASQVLICVVVFCVALLRFCFALLSIAFAALLCLAASTSHISVLLERRADAALRDQKSRRPGRSIDTATSSVNSHLDVGILAKRGNFGTPKI